MPELPEVETIVEDLNRGGLIGRTITEVSVYWERIVAHATIGQFCRQLKGRFIRHVYRRGKYIVFILDEGYHLIVHLRMTGRFELAPGCRQPGNHTHVVIGLDDQRCLMYQDTRKFGRFFLTMAPGSLLDKLGPEPLERGFSKKWLADQLAHRRRQIKPLLLDQQFVAGLGNIYVDEALWRSSIHPKRLSHSLTPNEIVELHRAIRSVLRTGIRYGGTSLGSGQGNYQSLRRGPGRNATRLKVFRRTGLPCLRCRRPIEKIIVGQRGTHFCPSCQMDEMP